MKRLLIALFSLALSAGFAVEEAEARRFGGGSSFGIQRTAPVPKAAPTTTTPRTAPASTTPSRGGLMGPIAGLAAGLGLAALFSSLGLGEDMASLFLVAVMAFMGFKLYRWISQPSARTATAGGPSGFDMPSTAATAPPVTPATQPDFDEAGFVRQAKLNFVRLQAAYDAGNLDDIREFTTPEVFAEIRMQYEERAGAGQQTDVVDLHAELLELVEEQSRYLTSVRFSGLIREVSDAQPAAFDEIWHLTKPLDGTRGWQIAGIQQAN